MKDSIFYDLMISNFFKYHKNISNEYANEFIKIIYDLLNMDDYENSSVFNDTLSKYRYPIAFRKLTVILKKSCRLMGSFTPK